MTEQQNKKPSRLPFNQQNKSGKRPPVMPPQRRTPVTYIIIIVLFFSALMMLNQYQNVEQLEWTEFVKHIENKDIKHFTVKENIISGQFTDDYINSEDNIKETFEVSFNPDVHGRKLGEIIDESGIESDASQPGIWMIILIQWVLPLLFFVGIFYFFLFRNIRGGAGGMLMSFGRSKHKLHGKDKAKETFKDVAGIEEAKDEVTEIIEFLKNPKKFQRLGGRIPRGVLLVGPPGCGKTLLAKAIAGEADVPFFSISGSDFVEMFVGVGASRVRDLFKQAKENSPCIIFLDEVDAIGRKRGPGFVGGGHDEREQTLNAILVEMDGFDTNDQVIVIAATNRADILDNALTRPGRFDRQIFVSLPDLKGRAEILKVHAKKVKMGPDANLERLARVTPMFSGADLAAIINEAALGATMANKDFIEMADLEEARDKVRWGRAKTSRVIDKNEKEIVAYHEAGHTLIQSLLKDGDPLHKVSIIPRGPMGGATFSLPEKDRTIFTKKYLMALLQVCYGGRIAEDIFCDDISSGASSDIKQATNIAKEMITAWGMSEELGLVNYSPDSGMGNSFYPVPGEKDYSDKTAEAIDNEVKRITNDAMKKARDLIEKNKDNVDKIAKALLKYETLDAEDVKLILDGGTIDKPTVTDLLAAEQAKNGNSDADHEQNEKENEKEQSSPQ
ncbi:MAG: ATP-dependent zinc metalloprotease FtsH [Sedimentisphaerales bacterium]|nr:ATP-dependent zinc metalloprotease FtsH [Sedimentisphaerales bacterium]